jgi:hypothetical protein
MATDWVQVYSSNRPYEIEMVMAFLANNEIECIRMNKQDSLNLIGEIEIYVKPEDAFNARQFIIQFEGE